MKIDKGGIINDFIQPNRKQYVIPVYQRNYEWAEEHCTKLFEDIVAAHRADNVSTFRADRICHIEMIDEKAVKRPKDFSLDRYSRQIFEMYDGDTVRVKLECRNELMKYIIDRFDESVETETATENTFYAYPEVALSPNFYSWLFKFAGEIRLLAPERARKEYIDKARTITENILLGDNHL